MPLKLERKIIEVGGSLSVTIPPGWFSAYNLTPGDKVDVLVNSVVIVKPKSLSMDVDLVARELQLFKCAGRGRR